MEWFEDVRIAAKSEEFGKVLQGGDWVPYKVNSVVERLMFLTHDHARLCDFVADEYNKQDDPGRLLPLPGLARPEGAGGLAMGRATEDCT